MNRYGLIGAFVVSFGLCAMAASATDSASARMNAQLQLNLQRYGIAGQALLVTHDDQVVFRGASGYADMERRIPIGADDVFEMYSVAKLFTNTLVMQLIEQGAVEPDTPASAYVPGLPASWKDITVRDFLNHTSGVPEYFDEGHATGPFPATREAVFASLADKRTLFPRGTQARFTQTNYVVLAALLEAHYGQPYPRIVADRIIGKLGLRHTFLGKTNLPSDHLPTEYIGKDGVLAIDPPIDWPAYSYGHAGLFSSVDDLHVFLRAMARGELVGKATLKTLWQPPKLANGRAGMFASGWEYGDSDAYWNVGHDGGTKVRLRMLFKAGMDGDRYAVIYLTTGSAKNVWSRVLVDSAMAAVAPADFPAEALQERLIAYALRPASDAAMHDMAKTLGRRTALKGPALERAVNNSGYTLRENLGVDAAIRVFALNASLFPASANAWDSLAEAYAAKGDKARADELHEKSRRLAAPSASR